ncbi:VOC family protein [Cryobacterium sp. BB307]|uniref:VOC family protein n=1 Tax=Cryobacterium sp. BB307 TaxID=2716317 RepID=UPI001447BDA7|nr:VOC family protein [Cryobacterium sp. BB307]
MLRVGSIVVRVTDLPRQEAFWTAALDYEPREPTRDDDFIVLRPRDGVGPNVSLDAHPTGLPIPPRIHLDLYTEHQAEEIARLESLGATRVHWDKRPDDADYEIMADPEGNRFCVVDVTR